jgi:MoaA/NifB/PqqE/SkfB family radical SAM enzyme
MASSLGNVEFLDIETTTRCNFRCGFCWGRHLPQGDIAIRVFQRALDTFPRSQHLDMTGEGEPLLHLRFFAMAAEARARGLSITFTTNGSLLTADNVDRILEIGFEKVAVSLESVNPERFRQLRGGALSVVLAGVRRLVERRDAAGLQRPSVALAVTVLRSTAGEMERVVRIYDDLGIDGGLLLQLLDRTSRYTRWYPPELAAECVTEAEEAQLWRKVGAVRAIDTLVLAGRACGWELLFQGNVSHLCPWLERAAFVTHSGYVTGCCYIKEPHLAFGLLGRDGPELIAEARDKVRHELAMGRIPECCAGCDTAAAVIAARAHANPDRIVALVSELRDRKDERARLERLLAQAQADVRALRTSWSWRISAPLRRARNLATAVRRRLSRLRGRHV